ncbi:MAG: hypothetical protein IKV85_07835 [Ruminococcus sp.]|nr:hypothetical protein [Ruminococcus sp.]
MKNTEQIAATVLRIRDEEQKKLMLRNRNIKRVTAGASSMLVFCAVILAVRNLKSSQGGIPTIDNNTIINTETPTTTSDTENITNDSTGTEHPTESTENAVKESTSAEKLESSTHSTEKTTLTPAENDNAETTGIEPTISNTAPSEQQTAESRTEAVTIPKWDERTLPTQFMEFDLNGIAYSTREHSIEGNHIGGILGTVTMEGQDVYEDKIHSINAEVFSINGISTNCAVAVKFNGYDSYYVYTNRCYSPATLGELVDALDLNNTISFGTLSLEDDRTFVTDYDRAIIVELLNKYRDCENRFDSDTHRKLFSISTNVDMLGISNKSFAVTEDGYIKTNIMEWAYTFYIGEDKAKEIADRLGIDNIERDTTPQVFNPENEVIYEE